MGGADLGLAYDIEPSWLFAVPGGLGTATLVMVLLKEQPAGAGSPVLVYRSVVSGSPLPCTSYYQTVDCTGSATVMVAGGGHRTYRVSGARAVVVRAPMTGI